VLLSVGLMNWDLYKNSKLMRSLFNKKSKSSLKDNEELNISN